MTSDPLIVRATAVSDAFASEVVYQLNVGPDEDCGGTMESILCNVDALSEGVNSIRVIARTRGCEEIGDRVRVYFTSNADGPTAVATLETGIRGAIPLLEDASCQCTIPLLVHVIGPQGALRLVGSLPLVGRRRPAHLRQAKRYRKPARERRDHAPLAYATEVGVAPRVAGEVQATAGRLDGEAARGGSFRRGPARPEVAAPASR